MSNNRATKKQKKQLIYDYQNIVTPNTKPKRGFLAKDLMHINQNFEVFTLYKTNTGTITSNSTTYITRTNTIFLNA